VLGQSPDDADEWIRSWTAQVSERAEAAARLAGRVSGLTATATGADGAVRATVDGAGVLTGLELDDRAQRMRGDELATEILRTIRRAQHALNAQVAGAVGETVGVESETGRAVLDSFTRRFPAQPSDEDRETS
jgi:hypothetical protein